MALSPKDILEKEFNSKFKGYDPQEVDSFLDEVMAEITLLNDEKKVLEARIAELESQLTTYKNQADKMSDAEERIMSTVLSAQRNAQMYLSKVEAQAQGIMDGATKNAKAIIEGAQIKMENIRQDMQKYQAQVQDYKERFRAFLDEQYTHMNNNIDQSEIQQSVADISKLINKLQEDMTSIDNQYSGINVSDIISDDNAASASAEHPLEEIPVKDKDEIKILVDELDDNKTSPKGLDTSFFMNQHE